MRIRRKRNSHDSSFSPDPPQSTLKPSRGWGELQAKSDYTLGSPGTVQEQDADDTAKNVVEKINAPEAVHRNEEEGEELQMKPETLQRNTPEEEDVQMKPLHPSIQRAILSDRF